MSNAARWMMLAPLLGMLPHRPLPALTSTVFFVNCVSCLICVSCDAALPPMALAVTDIVSLVATHAVSCAELSQAATLAECKAWGLGGCSAMLQSELLFAVS